VRPRGESTGGGDGGGERRECDCGVSEDSLIGEVFTNNEREFPVVVTSCIYTIVHMSAGSSVRVVFTEVSLLPQLPQEPMFGFKCFVLFAKGRDTDREAMYSDANETVIPRPG